MEGAEKILSGAARLCLHRSTRRFLHFMDPAEQREAQRIAREEGCGFASFGGYRDAERRIGCFFAEGLEPPPEEYPVVCLTSFFDSRFSGITHRDVLGAYMALGLTRASVGDIITEDSRVFLFTEPGVSGFVQENLRSAGKAALCFSETDPSRAVLPAQKGTHFRAVVGSLRLDAVLAAAFRLSRSRAADLIRGGCCKLDYSVCKKTDAEVSAGAMLSLAGAGRIRLVSIDGTTRRDRISITLFRYG